MRPSSELCVLANLVDRRAGEMPERIYAVFEEEQWTYGALRRKVRATAAALQDHGVQQGDHVLVFLPNGPAALRILFAINYLGAVCVPIGFGLRGRILEQIIVGSGARLLIADGGHVELLADLDLPNLQQVIALGSWAPWMKDLEVSDGAALLAESGDPLPLARPIEPWDTQCILYTSGTTGPSKGVLSSYWHRYSHATAVPAITGDDRRLIHGPLSHTGGFGSAFGMLVLGGSIALVESFKTDRFWDNVRRYEATVTSLLGATLPFLLGQEETEADRRHGLKCVLVAPVTDHAMEFSRRFNVPVYGVYNMTELSVPLLCGPQLDRTGLCGMPRPGVEIRLVDSADLPVEDGKAGELVLRSDMPWTLSHGYLDNAQATASAWRNGWFHTGDLLRRDMDGQYVYVDRLKDSVRRRGENVSSFEVEHEIGSFAGVKDVAVFGVPSEYSEDEVMAAIVLKDGAELDPKALLAWLGPRLPAFMIPRYVRIMPALPYTATHKVAKHELKQQGITPDTWDRVAHQPQRRKAERAGA